MTNSLGRLVYVNAWVGPTEDAAWLTHPLDIPPHFHFLGRYTLEAFNTGCASGTFTVRQMGGFNEDRTKQNVTVSDYDVSGKRIVGVAVHEQGSRICYDSAFPNGPA